MRGLLALAATITTAEAAAATTTLTMAAAGRRQQQEMTTDLRLQSLISDKDCSNICHLRPKIAAPTPPRAGGGRRVLPSQVASEIAAKLQLQMYLLLLLAASRFSGFVYEKLVGKGGTEKGEEAEEK